MPHRIQTSQSLQPAQSVVRRLVAAASVAVLAVLSSARESAAQPAVEWQAEYDSAMEQAGRRGAMALIWFHDSADSKGSHAFENALELKVEAMAILRHRFVAVKLATNCEVQRDGRMVRLLDQP